MLTNLTTERLSLKALAVDDHAFIQELLNTKGWLQFIGNRNVRCKEDAINYINKINSTQNLYYWVVHLKASHEPVGIITFMKRDYLEHFDIGFAFLPQYSGKGYAYEAASAVLAMVSAKPQHPVVLATTMPANTRSIRLLKKLGLRFAKEIETGNEKLHVYTTVLKQ